MEIRTLLPNLRPVDNKIAIKGGTRLPFSEDVATRFTGYGWVVQHRDPQLNGALLDTQIALMSLGASRMTAPQDHP